MQNLNKEDLIKFMQGGKLLCAYMDLSKLQTGEPKQTYFDFEGMDFEELYARAEVLEIKRRLEEEAEEKDEHALELINADTNIDTDYIDVWSELIMAHDWFAEIPRLKESIKSAEKNWRKELRKPIPTYEEYIRKHKRDSAWAFIKIAKPDVIKRLNHLVQEFNALEPGEKAKKWFQYRGMMQVTAENAIPYFIDIGGCKNCDVIKDMQERGFNHEALAGCLTRGCKSYGHDAANPFIAPEDVLEKALESGGQTELKNARQYIEHVRAMYNSCYENRNICLDSMVEELDANIEELNAHISPSEEQT